MNKTINKIYNDLDIDRLLGDIFSIKPVESKKMEDRVFNAVKKSYTDLTLHQSVKRHNRRKMRVLVVLAATVALAFAATAIAYLQPFSLKERYPDVDFKEPEYIYVDASKLDNGLLIDIQSEFSSPPSYLVIANIEDMDIQILESLTDQLQIGMTNSVFEEGVTSYLAIFWSGNKYYGYFIEIDGLNTQLGADEFLSQYNEALIDYAYRIFVLEERGEYPDVN